ncbi:MAG: nicotinamidase [Myxococcota bacterium]|nr:nicotinamidase [Myxococcota bacterium]
MKTLPLPDFYAPSNAAQWSYAPCAAQLASAAALWRRLHGVQPSASDTFRALLLLIDEQKDFCFPQGNLYVGGRSGDGAVQDSRRLVEFIYHHLELLTEITCTMDSHLPFQVFFAPFWIDAEGGPVAPYRELLLEELERGAIRPSPAIAGWLCGGDEAWLLSQVKHYCAELERVGKYRLYLWPPHCLLGSEGQTLVGVVQEARLFHAYVRYAPARIESKGNLALSENYSVFSPEVLTVFDGAELAQRNHALFEQVLSFDAVIIAGQAASHCVKSSVDDLLSEVMRRDPALAARLYVLTDCMSSVAIPDGGGGFVADFTPHAERAFQQWAEAGVHLVSSDLPMAQWPGALGARQR